jgi:hypothetical protein
MMILLLLLLSLVLFLFGVDQKGGGRDHGQTGRRDDKCCAVATAVHG